MLRFDGETSFLRSMEYVTLQDIGKARWRAKRTLPGCLGDRTLRSERRCHHTGAEEAATRAYSPSDYSAGRWMKTLVAEDFDENLFVGDESSDLPAATRNPPARTEWTSSFERNDSKGNDPRRCIRVKRKWESRKRYSMAHCYRYTILNVHLCIIPDSSRIRL